MKLTLDSAVRTLLLPLRPGTGGKYSDRAEEILNDMGVRSDHEDWVLVEAARWQETGTPSPAFRRFVKELLFSPTRAPKTFAIDVISDAADPDQHARRLSEEYFTLHAAMMSGENVSHQEASRILSHTHTIALLASGSGMTASRIYGMLSRDGIAIGRGWASVRTILDRLGFRQELKRPEVEALYVEDAAAEPELFGDLDIPESIQHAADACRDFGYRGDLGKQLRTLIVDNFHPPYLCMIHFQLTALTIYHHRVSNAYEFEPRGQGLLWLAGQYLNAGLDVAGSPFLNNAKSVDTLDEFWAATKRAAQRPSARALAELLQEFDTLSDPSRSAAARYLRCLFHRVMRITREKTGPLPNPLPALNAAQTNALCAGIARGNTGTTGVLEQRLTDCWLMHIGGDIADWHAKGFGDSVFATNTSRKKFGDAELKHRRDPRIIAVEAHGGHLTQMYVDEHLATLARVLPVRTEELEDRAPIQDWLLDLDFVSHSADPGLLAGANVGGLPVRITYRRFSDITPIAADPDFQRLVGEHFVAPLNVVHVPGRFRQAALELIA